MLRLENISKIYPTGEVLKDINWEVKVGERIGLVGVNGAGKSTQLKIIQGEDRAHRRQHHSSRWDAYCCAQPGI